MQVLVVDDSPLALRILAESLTFEGHHPVVAADATQALALLARQSVAVVISDWEMPGMSGPDLCRAVRGTERGHRIHFILLTSRDDRQSLKEACEAGADDLLAKPFDPDRLSLRMRSVERMLAAASAPRTALIPVPVLADQPAPGSRARPSCP